MRFEQGWWVHGIMEGPGAYLTRAQASMEFLSLVKKRRVVVQAGGHVGCYPKLLAAEFERVYCFEPDVDSFRCLTHNVTEPNAFLFRAVLGDRHRPVGLRRSKGNTGKTQIQGAGDVPQFCLDDLGLDHCDALFIDVEGYEVPLLRGGWGTLKKFRPVIVAEENKRLLDHGFKFGDIERLLAPLGYQLRARQGEDIILTV